MTTEAIAVWAEALGKGDNFVMGDTSERTGLPWGHAAEDMAHFRETTRGHVLVMGRGTYDKLPAVLKSPRSTAERPLVVLTSRYRDLHRETVGSDVQGIPWVDYPEDAAALVAEAAEWHRKPVAVIGGAKVLELFVGTVSRLVVTQHLSSYPLADVPAPAGSIFDGFHRTDQKRLSHEATAYTWSRL